MGKYLDIAQKVLAEVRQTNIGAGGHQECEISERSEISSFPSLEAEGGPRNITLADLQQAAGPDWAEIKNDPATLEALARSITIRRMRECGEVPPDYTATTVCRHCGPVPIYPGVAEHVQGCPWCLNRAKGLPMPKAPTKTQVQDLGPAMLKRDGCEGNSPWDYSPSDKVRIGQLIPRNERVDEPGDDT